MKLYLPGAGNKVCHIKNFKEVKDVSKVIISDIYEWAYINILADITAGENNTGALL